ncbi:uncharacterized protein [Amphiura filiformis]|uniref:uncharacterized protein n=1 Tax=Amphiura filiformis TaxID=82378 RepID=UPI003B21293B
MSATIMLYKSFLLSVFTFQLLLYGTVFGQTGVSNDTQILIIGGGPDALFAALTLNENNMTDFIILEGSDQLRGYLRTIIFAGLEFTPGLLWNHPSNPAALRSNGNSLHESNYSSYTVYTDGGDDITRVAIKSENSLLDAFDNATDAIIEDIDEGVRPDLSQKATLARGGWIANSAVDKVMEWFNFDFVEGRSARDISTIQAFRQAEVIPDEYFVLGNRSFLDRLESTLEGQFRLNQRVTVVNQTEGYVRAVTEDGTEYTGNYAIVTSTVGVIQNGDITFDPPLPPWKSEEFCRFQMGTIDPIFLRFETKFWDDTEFILHASDRHGYYPAFLNLEAEGLLPNGTNILIGFLTGDEAYRAELLTDDEVKAEIVNVLRNIYGEGNVPDPVEFYMSRFATDPDFYGTFPTWPIGIIPEDAQMRLRANVGRVYFAPEGAGDVDYIGIPLGSAADSGAAVEAVTRCMMDGDCEEYSPAEPKPPPPCSDVKPYNPNKRRKNMRP